MLITVTGGFLAGTLIAILTLLVEHSRIAFGSYALYGNGALVVPTVLAPFAIYPGWLWTLRRGGRALELALFVLGLHFGIGLTTILEVLFSPQEDGLGLIFALPGFLFIGAIFVLPAALLAASSYWLLARLRGAPLVVATLALVAVATFLAVLYGLGLGVLAGGGVAVAERRPSRAWPLGALLFVLMVVFANLPILFAPR